MSLIRDSGMHDYPDPIAFINTIDLQYEETVHINFINDAIMEAINFGSPNRILVNTPPQHGKSTYISKYFPAWYLCTHPTKKIILTSYESSYAVSWGREVRNLIKEHGGLFSPKIELSEDTKAKGHWIIDHYNGSMVATGVGGAITGKSGDIIIIDDPVKNYQQALSHTYRQNTIDWYKSVIFTRQQPGTIIILIMTRWHQGDLGGYLLSDEDPEDWYTIILPAIAEDNDPLGRLPGEALWSDRYPIKTLENIKQVLGPKMWSSLYCQNPVSMEGGLFQREWFNYCDVIPTYARHKVLYFDLAATAENEADDPDYTTGMLIHTGDYTIFYVSDIIHFRGTPETVETNIEKHAQLLAQMYGKTGFDIVIEQEGGASGKGWPDSIARTRLKGFKVIRDPPRNSKSTRAFLVSGATERGEVYLLPCMNTAAFVDEVCAFPDAPHDDYLDPFSGGYNYLMSKQGKKSRGVIIGHGANKTRDIREIAFGRTNKSGRVVIGRGTT